MRDKAVMCYYVQKWERKNVAVHSRECRVSPVFIYDINSIKKKKYIFPKIFSHGGRFWWFYRSSWSSGSRGGSASTESEE